MNPNTPDQCCPGFRERKEVVIIGMHYIIIIHIYFKSKKKPFLSR
jgi:hypothetical protein